MGKQWKHCQTILGGSKITADGDCSPEIKRCLLLGRSKRLLISWLQSPSAVILEPKKIKSDTVSPSISHVVIGPDAMIFVFWKSCMGAGQGRALTRGFSPCANGKTEPRGLRSRNSLQAPIRGGPILQKSPGKELPSIFLRFHLIIF